MAKQDKETYDSYEKDVYDNPPAGPMGVHRGARSAASRAMPYVCCSGAFIQVRSTI